MVSYRGYFTLDAAVLGRRKRGFFRSGHNHYSRFLIRPQVRENHVGILHFDNNAWCGVVMVIAQTEQFVWNNEQN